MKFRKTIICIIILAFAGIAFAGGSYKYHEQKVHKVFKDDLVPRQRGHSGKFLTTDGANSLWSNKIGNDDNYVEFKTDGEINLHGTARVTRHIELHSGDFVKHGANVPTTDTEGVYVTEDFQPGFIQEIRYEKNVPYRWADTTDMTVEWFWLVDANAPDAAKFVRLGVQYKSTAVGEAVTGVGTSFTQDVASLDAANYTAGTLMHTVMTTKILGSALTVHDILGLRFYRDGVADDLNDEARVIAIRVHFTMDRLGEAS